MSSFDGSNSHSLVLTLTDLTAAGAARRETSALATRLGFSEEATGRVALVVTELVTNAVRHAGGGELLCRSLNMGAMVGLEVLVLDRGPGIPNLSRSMSDGTSTRGTLGLGLGVLTRNSDEWDVHTGTGLGTAILARFWPRPPSKPPSRFLWGGVSVPRSGEIVCGDAWSATEVSGHLQVAVVDGLGHGPLAAEAARRAVEAFERRGQTILDGTGLTVVLDDAHRALRAHRGAAMTVASIDAGLQIVHLAGVGNVGGQIVDMDGKSRGVVAHNGTLGVAMRTMKPFIYPWKRGSMLILYSDGLASHLRLDRYPGLLSRDPALIAGILYRDFKRGTDDVTVFVARERA